MTIKIKPTIGFGKIQDIQEAVLFQLLESDEQGFGGDALVERVDLEQGVLVEDFANDAGHFHQQDLLAFEQVNDRVVLLYRVERGGHVNQLPRELILLQLCS